jgi:hypothetical protein
MSSGSVALPELRVRLKKRDADAQPPVESFADVDHAALALGLVFGVGKAKPLAGEDVLRERESATAVIQIQRECFLVKRLLVGVGAVDEKRNVQLDAFAIAPVAPVSFELLFLRALDGSSPMLLCGPQRVPNPAHSDPQGWPPQLTSKY